MLGHQEQRGHAPLAEIGEELVDVQRQEALARRGVEIAVEAVDDDHSRVLVFHGDAQAVREFAGRDSAGSTCRKLQLAGADHRFDVHAEPFGTLA